MGRALSWQPVPAPADGRCLELDLAFTLAVIVRLGTRVQLRPAVAPKGSFRWPGDHPSASFSTHPRNDHDQ